MTYLFTLPRLERVIAGPDTLASLPAEMDRYHCQRALVVTGRTLAASPLMDRVRRALGSRCVDVFAGAIQHVPASSVQALLREMHDRGIDCLVSVGGGSPIDTAKAAAHAAIADAGADPRAGGPVQIAIPTTLSAAEFTDVAGVTDDTTRIKHAVSDQWIAPRTVIADPVVTLDTPDWLWAASGVRALDHAVESLYSSRHHPVSDPLAARAIEMLVEHLPPSLGSTESRGGPSGPPGSRTAHRGECQMAAWLAVFGITNAGFGLSHVLGHQIGPRWNVAHGVTSAIMLPHAMRFMAAAAPERFVEIARAFRVPFAKDNPKPAALECAERTAAFIHQFNLPARLRDVSIPAEELPEIAGHVRDVMNRERALDRVVTLDEVESILAAAH